MKWTANHIPDLTDKVIIVTGANSGLGYESAKALAAKHATVIMACRTISKAEAAKEQILAVQPSAKLVVMELDLSSLDSVRAFTQAFDQQYDRLDILLNNAGLMAIPQKQTADGFEMQLGVNHLGHFALTALLFPNLIQTAGSRVVNVSSSAHRMGEMDFSNLNWEKDYSKWPAYGRSKLANLLFTHELTKRLAEHDLPLIVASAHPGWATTELQEKGPKMEGSGFMQMMARFANALVAQGPDMGALPQLFAATAPDVEQGGFYGPDGWQEMRGYPTLTQPRPGKVKAEEAARLFEVSEQLTGVRFDFEGVKAVKG